MSLKWMCITTKEVVTKEGLAFAKGESVEVHGMKDLNEEENSQLLFPGIERSGRICPYCAETIKFEAIKCRFCGSELEPNININTAIQPDEDYEYVAYSSKLKKYVALLKTDFTSSFTSKPSGTSTTSSVAISRNSKESGRTCPTCGSNRVTRFSKTWKVTKIASVGPFGLGNVTKTMKCKDCGYKW